MFNDLDASLKQLINDAPLPELTALHNAEVVFFTPETNFPRPGPTVDLFLYEVRENRDKRDSRPIVERNGDHFTTRPAPLRADCAYIVTTWDEGDERSEARIASEHRLLGQALTWMSRFGTLPDRYLQGLLGAPDRLYPLPAMVAQSDPNQNAGDFWVAMGIPPRPAFGLTVTVELDLGDPVRGDLVTSHRGVFRADGDTDAPWIGIGGRVVDTTAGEGIEAAVVDIVDLTLRTRSGAEGRYSFPRVPPGSHTIRVVGRGFTPRTQPLVVPGRPEDYLVELTPLP